jgi:hypothetical protein
VPYHLDVQDFVAAIKKASYAKARPNELAARDRRTENLGFKSSDRSACHDVAILERKRLVGTSRHTDWVSHLR